MATRRTQPAAPRTGRTRLVRAAAEVSVYAGPLGFVRVSKTTACRLLRERPRAVSTHFVPELDLLLIEPAV